MGKQLTKQVLAVIKQGEWPKLESATEHGRRIFLQAMERVDEFKGDPEQLLGTIRLLQTADSRPFALAGAAYTLVAAAKDRGGVYDEDGLKAAMFWLEKAQDMEAEIIEINCIEAIIYIHSNRFEDARLILDYLSEIDPYNFYLHQVEVVYWVAAKDKEQAVEWIERTIQSAVTIPQRLRMRAKLGDVYLNAKEYEKAVDVLKEAIHFDKENASLWYRLSVAYYRLSNFAEADRANKQTLRLQSNHAAALKVQEALKKQKGGTGGLRRLFGG
ncbi:MAG: tetratricopeptide repeat protein [Chloroflexota bacterium]